MSEVYVVPENFGAEHTDLAPISDYQLERPTFEHTDSLELLELRREQIDRYMGRVSMLLNVANKELLYAIEQRISIHQRIKELNP